MNNQSRTDVTVVYDTVLFDWDGCLAQTLDIWISAFTQEYGDYGIDLKYETVAAHFGDWNSALQFGVAQEDWDDFHARVFERVLKALPAVDLYVGVAQLLHDLHEAGTRLGLVSSSQAKHIDLAMKRHGIAHYFDAIVTIDDVENHKPHPESLELALAKLGVGKERSVMIGDSTKDLEAASNAGVASILVFPRQHHAIYDFNVLAESNPTHICTSFDEVRKVLFALE